MASEKICILEHHIIPALEEQKYGHILEWEDRSNGTFRISWNGQYRPGTKNFKNKYADWCLDWDIKKGRKVEYTPKYISKSKERVRNALRKLKSKVKELPIIGGCRRYQFLQYKSIGSLFSNMQEIPEQSPLSVRSDHSSYESDTSGYFTESPINDDYTELNQSIRLQPVLPLVLQEYNNEQHDDKNVNEDMTSKGTAFEIQMKNFSYNLQELRQISDTNEHMTEMDRIKGAQNMTEVSQDNLITENSKPLCSYYNTNENSFIGNYCENNQFITNADISFNQQDTRNCDMDFIMDFNMVWTPGLQFEEMSVLDNLPGILMEPVNNDLLQEVMTELSE